jgi:O-antigen/teichoic acid export membrane protein
VRSLSQNIFSGVSWTVVQTSATKIFSFVAQIVLAWILLPEDFGKISLTYTVTNIGLLLQNFGLADVLVARGKSFFTYLPLARTISLLAGIICLLITLLLGVVGSFAYHDGQIFTLVIIYSCAIPLNAMSVVPASKLRIDLKFKTISLLASLMALLTHCLTVLFALCGLGVYSFVIPPIIVALLNCGILYHLTNLSIKFIFTLRRWWMLVSKSAWGFVHSLCQNVIFQSDYIVLGLVASQSTVGIYAMAYSLSVQVIGLLSNNIAPVLFPSLMTVSHNKELIKNVLIKCTVFFAMIGIPFALWQGASANPLIKIFLPDKWLGTIPLIEILSIGMGYRVVSSLWAVACRVRADFKTQAYYSIISSVAFILLLLPFSYWLQDKGTAIAVSLFYFVSSPILLYFAFRFYSIKIKEILAIFIKYSVIAILAFLPVYVLSKYVDNIWLCLIMNGVLSPIIYLVLLYFIDYKNLMSFVDRIKTIRLNKP